MNLAPVDQIIIVAYLLGLVTVGVWMKRRAGRNLQAYFLGERQLPWWALAMSGSSSYFDITGTMWIVMLFFTLGMKGMWVQWIWGFPITVFYLAYMGKWIRRSGVMTGAEWMRTRFGAGRGGEVARLAYTLYAVLTITAFLAYGAVGMGKFGHVFLPTLSVHHCAAWILSLTGIYVVVGGLIGVVFTEVIQTVILSLGALLIAYLGWAHLDPAALAARVRPDWASLVPTWRLEALANVPEYAGVTAFGALALVWVVKGLLLDLSGPEQLYDFQRFLAVKDSRDACKLGALWGVIHTVRWPMAMALAVLALTQLGITDPKQIDAETVLPRVISDWLPVGLKGFALAALLSAFLATFSATVNGGASYLVRDLYQKYLRPQAGERELVTASYLASALLIMVGLLVSFQADSIGKVFTWIMGTLGAGVLLPNVLRWYWWRLNGWGYGVATLVGMVLSLLQVFIPSFAAAPLYVTFPLIAGTVLLIAVSVTLCTPPTEGPILGHFYRTVQPAGAWGSVARQIAAEDPHFQREPFGRDLLNLGVGLPGLLALYIFPLYLVLHQYPAALLGSLIAAASAGVLTVTWYRHLPPPEVRKPPPFAWEGKKSPTSRVRPRRRGRGRGNP